MEKKGERESVREQVTERPRETVCVHIHAKEKMIKETEIRKERKKICKMWPLNVSS